MIINANIPLPSCFQKPEEGDVFYDTVPLMSEDRVPNPGSMAQILEDPAEMAVLHDRLYPRLFRYARFRTNDPATAEDLASQAFLHLLEATKTKRKQIDNIDAWLMGTLSNLVNDHLRRRYHQPKSNLDETLISGLPNPHTIVEHSERNDVIALALEQLTDDQQQVLSLRFGAEMSLAETALIMERQENAVKALQFRALNALRRRLNENSHE